MTVIDLSNVTIVMNDKLCHLAVGVMVGQYLALKEIGIMIVMLIGTNLAARLAYDAIKWVLSRERLTSKALHSFFKACAQAQRSKRR